MHNHFHNTSIFMHAFSRRAINLLKTSAGVKTHRVMCAMCDGWSRNNMAHSQMSRLKESLSVCPGIQVVAT